MSVKTSSSTELSAVDSAVAEAVASEPDAVEYPEGHWIAQSVWHGDAVRLATAALHNQFANRDEALVAMELIVYYEFGNNRAWLQPDVLVAFGVGRGGNRRTFKVWEEGKAPGLCAGSGVTVDGRKRRAAQGAGVRPDRGARVLASRPGRDHDGDAVRGLQRYRGAGGPDGIGKTHGRYRVCEKRGAGVGPAQ